MQNLYTKIHGTTVDRFKVGNKAERITLTGKTTTASAVGLLDRDGNQFISTSTVFFTAYVIGKGTNVAAYEIKGCYLAGTTTVTGYVVNTYVDTANFTEPTFSFNSNGTLTVNCTGHAGDTIDWTAVIDLVYI